MMKETTTTETTQNTQRRNSAYSAPLILGGISVLVLLVGAVIYAINKNSSSPVITAATGSTLSKKAVLCPFNYKNSVVDICLDPVKDFPAREYMLAHRFNGFFFHADNGSLGFTTFNERSTLMTNNAQRITVLPGSNGNYRIVNYCSPTYQCGYVWQQLIAYQDASPNAYPPNKEPSNADSNTASPLVPRFFNLNDVDGTTIKATLSPSKMVTEWKIALDPTDSNYIVIEVPDAATTGSELKKYIGGRLSLAYMPKGAWTSPSTWTGTVTQGYSPSMVKAPAGVTPDWDSSVTQGSNKDQFVITSTNMLPIPK